MSIASRIESMTTHLQNDYDALESVVGTITEDKNIENIAPILDNLWEELPHTTGTGTSLSLATKAGKMKVNLLGNTSQTGTPTPSSPIPVNVVSGDNTIKVTGKNLFDSNLKQGGRYFNDGTYFNASNYVHNENPISVIAGETYTLSATNYSAGSEAGFVFFNNGTFVSSSKQSSQTFTVPNGANQVYCDFYNDLNITPNDFTDIQLELGTNASDFEPYTSTSYPIHLGTYELCKIGTYQDRFIRNSGKNLLPYYQSGTYTHNGITYTSSGNGVYTISNTATDNSYWEMTLDKSYTIEEGDYIQLNNDKAVSNAQFVLRDTSNVQIAAFGCSEINRIISLSSYVGRAIGRIRCYVVNGTAVGNMALKPMICKSSTSVPFEPYGTNEWYLEKKIGKVVLDGSETWTTTGLGFLTFITGAYALLTNDTAVRNGTIDYVKSNYFSISGLDTIYNNGTTGITLCRASADNNIQRLIFGYSGETLDTFKTWLSSHNTTVYYILSTPTYTKITGTLKDELESVWRANSYNGTTNISQVNYDLPFNLDITALEG